MEMRGFDKKWRDWINQVVIGGTISIKMNDKIGSYIESYKGSDRETLCLPFFLILLLIA